MNDDILVTIHAARGRGNGKHRMRQVLLDLAWRPSQAFTSFERIRRRRVERVVAQGARNSASKAAGPIGRIVRDHMLPFVFRYLVTEQSLAWMFEHHIDWNSRTARDELVA